MNRVFSAPLLLWLAAVCIGPPPAHAASSSQYGVTLRDNLNAPKTPLCRYNQGDVASKAAGNYTGTLTQGGNRYPGIQFSVSHIDICHVRVTSINASSPVRASFEVFQRNTIEIDSVTNVGSPASMTVGFGKTSVALFYNSGSTSFMGNR